MKKILSVLIFSLIVLSRVFSASASEYYSEGLFYYTVTDNEATIIGFSERESEFTELCGTTLTIPATIGGYKVVAIGDYAFRGKHFFYEVKLPASVKRLGVSAFEESLALEKVNLENVKIIGDGAFASCALKEVVLPDGIEIIGGGAFSGCEIKEIVIPEGKTVGDSAFAACEKLEKILIGDNCTLDMRSFNDTSSVKTIDIGKNCVIGESAFSASGAETVVIGDGAIIGDYAFSSCNMKKIDLGQPVSLGEGAFHSCTNLKEVTVPGSVEEIPGDCFAHCSNLEKVTLGEGVKRIKTYAFSNTNLKEAYLPRTLEPFELWAIYAEWIFYSGTLQEWKELDWAYGDENVVVNWRPLDPSYIPESVNEITIIGKGTAYGRFLIKKVNNTPAKNMEIEYSINGNATKKTQTDENGIAYVTIENITESQEYDILFTGTPIQTTKGIMKVTVEPLKFKSEYEAAITGGLNLGLGFGVEGSIGELEGEAMLADVGASVAKEKGISFAQEYDGDKVSLTITSKQNIELASEAKAGLFAGVNIGNIAGVDVSLGEISGTGKRGKSISVGYEDSDFDVNDESDIDTMSRVVASALLENYSYNLAVQYVLDKIAAPVNVTEKGSAVTLEAGASLGVFEVGGENFDLSSEATLAGGKGALVSENSTATLPDRSIEYNSKAATETGITFGEVNFKVKRDDASLSAGLDMFGGKAKNAVSVSATRGSTGSLNRLSFATEMVMDDSIFLFEDTTTNKFCITYEDAAARAVANDYSILHNFTNGAKGHFNQEEVKKVSNTMVYSGEQGTYSVRKEKKHGFNLDLSGSVALVLKFGGSFGLSGIERYEFEEYSGVYENNSAYIQAYNDIEEEVQSKLITAEDVMGFVEDKITIILEEYWEIAKECVDDVKDSVVSFAEASVQKTSDAVTGFSVSIFGPKDESEEMSVMALNSDYYDYYTGTTVGRPYIISVEDENGEEVSEFSENPLKLTLGYTEEMLAEVNAYPEALCILFWDDTKSVYVNMGGELDAENSQLTLIITKPGQYVLAYDECEPQISELSKHFDGEDAVIEAVVEDFSGVKEIRLYVNDNELVNKDNFENYYNATTGRFCYRIENLEKDTGYDIQLVAVDAFEYEAYKEEYVYIENKTYQITDVTAFESVIGQKESFCVTVTDELCQIRSVYMNVEVCDIYKNIYTETILCTFDDEGNYTAEIPVVQSGSTVTVWATVYDRLGSLTETEKQTALVLDKADAENAVTITGISDEGVTVEFKGSYDLSECKIILAAYKLNGVLESIDIKPADSTVLFERTATDKTYKVYLWNGSVPVCEASVNATYDTLF